MPEPRAHRRPYRRDARCNCCSLPRGGEVLQLAFSSLKVHSSVECSAGNVSHALVPLCCFIMASVGQESTLCFAAFWSIDPRCAACTILPNRSLDELHPDKYFDGLRHGAPMERPPRLACRGRWIIE